MFWTMKIRLLPGRGYPVQQHFCYSSTSPSLNEQYLKSHGLCCSHFALYIPFNSGRQQIVPRNCHIVLDEGPSLMETYYWALGGVDTIRQLARNTDVFTPQNLSQLGLWEIANMGVEANGNFQGRYCCLIYSFPHEGSGLSWRKERE